MSAFREGFGAATRAAATLVSLFAGGPGPGNLLTGLFPGSIGAVPTRGTKEFLQAYSTMPWLRAVVGKIAASLASVEWQLFYAQTGGTIGSTKAFQRMPGHTRQVALHKAIDRGTVRRIDAHPWLDAMATGNSYLTGLDVQRITHIHREIVGEAFWVKQRAPGRVSGGPIGVWPIPPHWVLSTPTPTKPTYRLGAMSWQVELPETEVVWMADPDPANPYGRGSGTMRALADELETDECAAKYTAAFFRNSGIPAVLISADGLQPAETKRLELTWAQKLQGYSRAHRTHFLNRKVEVHEFGQNFRELQFTQLRQNERDIIIHSVGLSPELFGILESSNRSTIDAAWYLFAQSLLVPRLEAFRCLLQERIIAEYDPRILVDYVSPVGEDRDYRLRVMGQAPWAFSVDEHRAEAGADPLEGERGQVYMIPFTLTPARELIGAIPAPKAPAPGVLGPPAAPAAGLEPALVTLKAALAVRRLEDPDRAGDAAALTVLTRALADNLDDLPGLVRLASRMAPQLRREFLAAVDRARGVVDVERLAQALQAGQISLAEILTAIEGFQGQLDGLVPVLRQGFLLGAEYAGEDLRLRGVTLRLDLVNPAAVGYAGTEGARLIREVSAESRQAVQATIQTAISQGIPPAEAARTIQGIIGLTERQAAAVLSFRARLEESGVAGAAVARRVGQYADAQLRVRAVLIARTETLTALNAGQRRLWLEATRQGLLNPETTRRRWITTPDDRLDPECERLDGEEVGLEEPFSGGVVEPPLHPNCRCTTGLVFAPTPATPVTEAVAPALTGPNGPHRPVGSVGVVGGFQADGGAGG